MSIQDQANRLFEDQKQTWPLLGANWDKLGEALHRTIGFEGFSIHIQCNPKRIVSSAARVDKSSIEQRKCFLCPENRPDEEKSLWFGEDYEILCNPFPIFPVHFTIATARHTPQVILPEFERFLELARALNRMAVFYNAPNCGASAPDHMHFQAGSRGLMPLEEDLVPLGELYGRVVIDNPALHVTAIEDGLRRFLLLESDRKELLVQLFGQAFRAIRKLQDGEEPMINMLAYYRDTGWQLMLFPREKHRPWQYFEEGEKHILLSPASVDMGGTLITPLEKDFHKITRADVEDIFSQVSFPREKFGLLVRSVEQTPISYE